MHIGIDRCADYELDLHSWLLYNEVPTALRAYKEDLIAALCVFYIASKYSLWIIILISFIVRMVDFINPYNILVKSKRSLSRFRSVVSQENSMKLKWMLSELCEDVCFRLRKEIRWLRLV